MAVHWRVLVHRLRNLSLVHFRSVDYSLPPIYNDLGHPLYSKVLQILTAENGLSERPPKLLDLGTCVGQDLRVLHHDGAPISALYGSDVFAAFEGVGHALFRDLDRFTPDHFIVGDIFKADDHTSSLGRTAGS